VLRIVPYQYSWPEEFAREARTLQREFGGLAQRIDHVGSTAVPGLSAKPVIDIQISVLSLNPSSPFVVPLERLGYAQVHFGEFDKVYPFFTKPPEWPSTHHVHLCEVGGEQEARHLAFRNYLRDHPALARQYVELKVRLAAANHGTTIESRESYSLGKTDFVETVLAHAQSAGYYDLSRHGGR
jgi:GrpB-like predicted nucleotidyltransferase (UPF0157 family)